MCRKWTHHQAASGKACTAGPDAPRNPGKRSDRPNSDSCDSPRSSEAHRGGTGIFRPACRPVQHGLHCTLATMMQLGPRPLTAPPCSSSRQSQQLCPAQKPCPSRAQPSGRGSAPAQHRAESLGRLRSGSEAAASYGPAPPPPPKQWTGVKPDWLRSAPSDPAPLAQSRAPLGDAVMEGWSRMPASGCLVDATRPGLAARSRSSGRLSRVRLCQAFGRALNAAGARWTPMCELS